ncbi:NADH-quinone oxidoreductase subunit L [Desulfuromonas sp. KJ2020]|uniref:NADH-quinone oxidoreductase subunit L n=1 Tax=Desulfuromonas sp. KJ2020 TaxID=2919173 RepID=UPI0020A7B14F|nr:NADH-quinone oxidoreductase subunit L [Desulfuromonas sp. KJ2020]MCP3175908.1 NADH-quinone oxidoreductase subunit L [Desulfuromonas sp. KJ2020]
MTHSTLLLIPLAPLMGGILNVLFGRLLPRRLSEFLAVAGVAASALLTLAAWPLASEGTRVTLFTWLQSGPLQVPFELLFDPLSAPMALMVTAVSTLIHLYAIGYMQGEEGYARFFALLNLFVFAMLLIVLADNLLVLFLGWEGVGFCSYALIGFWYRQEKNANAGRKAFLVTRVGDVFLGIAILWLFHLFGTLSISAINSQATGLAAGLATPLVVLLLLGACGKSAQLPLMTWLPDAMAGPTPVSALIHAATMVTAGVYLLCRFFPLVSLSATGMALISAVGALTAFYAATCALAQREIKKVLAYSTMSQVGYMFLGVGSGAVAGAMFHLFTHAFFKALLFMAAGCVIHLCAHENDIFRMGGLARKSPLVFLLFLAGALSLAGAPLSSGFFSKDSLLAADYARHTPFYEALFVLAVLTALLTAFYTFRLVYLVFAGPARFSHEPHPLPRLMTWPLIPLALVAIGGGLINLPEFYGGHAWLAHFLGSLAGTPVHISHREEGFIAALAIILFALAWLLTRHRYQENLPAETGPVWRFLAAGWQADALIRKVVLTPFASLARFFWQGTDAALIDGILHSLARGCQFSGDRLRALTSGRLSHYLAAVAWGLLLIMLFFLLQLAQG